jgi:hypothetical protein
VVDDFDGNQLFFNDPSRLLPARLLETDIIVHPRGAREARAPWRGRRDSLKYRLAQNRFRTQILKKSEERRKIDP